jgi:hypothetical protein
MQVGNLKQIKNTEAKTEERNGTPTSAASANGQTQRSTAVLPILISVVAMSASSTEWAPRWRFAERIGDFRE